MSRFAHATYCDDIRQEVGNKRSIIGIYSATLYVPSLPAILPKLCIAVVAVTPTANPFKSVTIRILIDDAVFAEHKIDESQLQVQQTSFSNQEDVDNNLINQFHFAIQVAPFQIEKAMLVRTRVIADGEELKAGGLRIELMPSEPKRE